MPTVVTSTIGTASREYSTLQAWEDACPANLVTDDKVWRGEAYNDSEFTAAVTISGMTTDATRYVELTVAAGQSFVDQDDKRSNPLRYDQSKGVAVTATTQTIRIQADHTRLSRFQCKATGSHGSSLTIESSNCLVEKLISRASTAAGHGNTCTLSGAATNTKIKNAIFYSNRYGCALGGPGGTGNEWHHCTFLSNGVAGTPFTTKSNNHTQNAKFYNCAVFNYSAFYDASDGQITHFQNCVTNFANPGDIDDATGTLWSKTYANQFVATGNVDTTHDARAKSGGDLLGNGNAGVSGTPTDDLFGYTRQASPTIGAWERVTAIRAKSIGTTGRDYSTLQAWEDASPSNLVNNAEVWRGECYNDSEFTSATDMLMISGVTTDASHYRHLTTGEGQSFRDHASVQTNPLRYDATKGVGIRLTGNYAEGVNLQEANARVSKLQFAGGSGNGSQPFGFIGGTGKQGLDVDGCIVELSSTSTGTFIDFSGFAGKIRNCVFVDRTGGAGRSGIVRIGFTSGSSVDFINCTLAVASDKTAVAAGFFGEHASVLVKNCLLLNVSAIKTGGSSYTFTTNRTTVASPGAGWTTVTYADEVESGVDATRDFRLKSGSTSIDTGTTDATNAANDIVGTARPSGSACDVGAWEFVISSTPQILVPIEDISTGAWTPSSGAELYPMLDEAVADHGDFIQANSAGECEVRLTAPNPPTAGTYTIKYWARRGSSPDLILKVMEGATQIATWTDVSVPTTNTLFSRDLTTEEKALITDPTNLRLRFGVA